ncbi:MAG TPA: type II secretion system F family protein [Anaerolineales bacterium]|nr:type II secretion system F family protein [Anaerolineales bacterium]
MDNPLLVGLILGGGILVIILLVIGLVVTSSRDQNILEDRLTQYLGEQTTPEEQEEQRRAISNWVSKRVEKTSFGGRISQNLARADLKFRVGEYMALVFISMAVVGGLAFLVGRGSLISLAIGAILGYLLPGIYVARQKARRLNRFNDQLSDMLNLMVNGLRAGYSTLQAMEAISRELPTPICDEFRRVVQEMQLGIPMDAAMANLLRRIPSDDLDFVVTAINVQREVGGNLSEILDTISFTIRERVRIKGEIRVITSQVRASGIILSLIPIGLTIVLWFLNPEYLMSFGDAGPLCAWGAGTLVVVLISLGYFVMTRIAAIEI